MLKELMQDNLAKIRQLNRRRRMLLQPKRSIVLRPDQEATLRFGLIIFSADMVTEFIPEQFNIYSASLIRIHGHKENIIFPLLDNVNYKQILVEEFDDVLLNNGSSGSKKMEKRISYESAERIANILLAIKNETLVVHCHAGVSRSAAVGLVYARMYHLRELENIILNCGLYSPNQHVVDMVSFAVQRMKESVA